MRPTDEERREVAENLRNMCCCGCRYAEQFYELLKETVMNSWDFHEFGDVAERLADLIEPEPERTCENKVVKNNKEFPPEYRTDNFICSACGAHFFADSEYINHPIDWAFCPDCGAKVVGE